MAFNKLSKFFLRQALVWSANRIAKRARKNASWSDKIPEAIKVGTTQESGNSMSIAIEVDMKIAPHALAFEKGSGIHGATHKTYKIAPKTAGALAFYWPGGPPATELWGSNKFLGVGDDGRLLFSYVDHPGVEARPYLEPAVDSSINSVLNKLSGATVDMIKDSFGARVEIIK